MRELEFYGGNILQPIIKYIQAITFSGKYFFFLLINVASSAICTMAMLKINYWPSNTNTEGLRENCDKLCFSELPQNFLRLAVAIFLIKKTSKSVKLYQLTYLMQSKN